MRVIDFRLRPAIPQYLAHLEWRVAHHPQKSTSPVAPALARALAPDDLIVEMDRLGIEVGVFTARDWYGDDPNWPFTNEAIAATAEAYPTRLIGFGGVDPRRPDAAALVRTAKNDLGLRGICVDGFVMATSPADPAFDPIYRACVENDLPVVITLGALPAIPSPMDASHPRHVDDVAMRFGDLRIVMSHAAWPFTSEMLGVVFRHDNVWFENSFYHFAPGVPDVMVHAINEWVTDRAMFASAFPSAPLGETIERLARLDFTEEARHRMFFENARELLGLAV